MTVYIKKLWSLTPTKYKCIPLKKALEEYYHYVQACMHSNIVNCITDIREGDIKTFEQWRTTEI